MYFPKSAAIAEAHSTLAPQIELVDDLIYTIGDFPIRVDQMADSVGIQPPQFERILRLYVGAGILQSARRLYCRRCESLVDEGLRECDNCEADFSAHAPDSIDVFVAVDPVVRVEPDPERAEPNSVVVRVQFVAGDRGGTQKNQLQLPKELRAIREAIAAAEHRECVASDAAILAASVQDLGTLYTTRPTVVHFGGHGDDRSLAFVRDQELLADVVTVTADRLVRILREFPERVSLCVFNTCDSSAVAQSVVDAGVVDFAIGWDGTLPDAVAITFAAELYRHITNGLSLGQAFGIAEACSTAAHGGVQAVLVCHAGLQSRDHYPVKP